MRQIQQKTSTKRSESIAHLKSQIPTMNIALYDDNGFPHAFKDIIFIREDKSREAIKMKLIDGIDEEHSINECLWSGVSSTGWLIYAYRDDKMNDIEYTKCFDSTDVVTKLSQYKKKFTGL
jgi:hypothetical protein